MAEKEHDESTVAVLERPAEEARAEKAGDEPKAEAPAATDAQETEKARKKRGKKEEPAIDEYEIEFDTPFGKIEFEFEPKSTKERKDREKRAKAEAEATKAAAKAAAKAEKQALKAAKKGKPVEAKSGGGKLLPILIIFGIIAASVVIAYWLFARPEPEDEIPAEFRNEPMPEPVPEPQGFMAKAQHRIKDAVRSGRQASADAQREQEQRFRDLTHQ